MILTTVGTSVAESKKAEVSSIKPSELKGFDTYPPKVKQLVEYALHLTTRKLKYQYGGNSPDQGGMDCSGTVQHILTHLGYQSPRQCNYIYLWVRKNNNLFEVNAPQNLSDPSMANLQPGDLLFWEGTYNVGERFPPTSHVMIYLGHLASNGKPVMVGASSGRYYNGKARHGVSIFDFRMPRSTSKSKFVGYGPVPGIKSLNKTLPALEKPTATKPDPEKETAPVAPPVKTVSRPTSTLSTSRTTSTTTRKRIQIGKKAGPAIKKFFNNLKKK